MIAVRSGQEPASAARVTIPGLTDAQLASIAQALPPASRAAIERAPGHDKPVYPLDVRKAVVTSLGRPNLVFDDVDGVQPDPLTRELLAFIAISPEPLTLDDLLRLSSGGPESAVATEAKLRDIDHLIVDDGLGYRPIHDELAADLRAALAARLSLHKFVCLRLGQFFAKRHRHAAAFALFRRFDSERALRSAHRAASQAAVQGRLPQSIPLLEYISDARRSAGQRIELAISLLALAQAQESVGNAKAAAACLVEAEETATAVGDQILVQAVRDHRLISRIRRELRPADLEALREIRTRYAAEGRLDDAGRLACEEGTILLTINAHEKAAAILREARQIFLKTGDRHGIHVATRNLVATLNMIEGGQAEAEHLLRELEGDDYGFDKLRERAWICNILARRYRYDGRLDDAVAVAREAIDIGRKLGDPYLVALNRIALGNALDQKDDLSGSLECFKESSREAQAIKRPEMETLASRRAADVLVQMADKAAPLYRAKLYGEAESFATYALGLARGSIAEHDAGIALETRADARSGLGKKAEADADYATAARIFFRTREDDAARIIRHMVANIDLKRPKETIENLMAAIVDPAQTQA